MLGVVITWDLTHGLIGWQFQIVADDDRDPALPGRKSSPRIILPFLLPGEDETLLLARAWMSACSRGSYYWLNSIILSDIH